MPDFAKRNQAIFVSSALNAYQASNIYFLENKKEGADKTDSTHWVKSILPTPSCEH